MPDEDIFQRTFAPGWRPLYRMAKGGAVSESQLGGECVRALARTLREAGGCPGLNDFVRVIHDFQKQQAQQPLFVAGGLVKVSEAFSSLRNVEQQNGGHRVTKVAARAARSLLSGLDGGAKWPGPVIPGEALAERICLALADHHFFGPGRGYLVQERFGDFGSETKWERLVKERMGEHGLRELATQLAKKPDAKGLRAPRSARTRKSTAEILNEPLTP